MTVLYHCTPRENLDAILADGLDPGRSRSSLAAVFLSDDEFTAANYAGMRDGEAVVLAVDLEDLDESLLSPDNYELPDMLEGMSADDLEGMGYREGVAWDEVSWRDSLRICSQVAYAGRIHPSAIRVVESAFLRAPPPGAAL